MNCSDTTATASDVYRAYFQHGWSIAIFVTTILFGLSTFILFGYFSTLIRRHHPFGPKRTFIVRLIGLFPVFSITSLTGFLVPRASNIAKWGSSMYLAHTIYSFLLLLMEYYGGPQEMVFKICSQPVSIARAPLACCFGKCLPKVHFDPKRFHLIRYLVLQVTIIRPLCVFLNAVMWADGVQEDSFPLDYMALENIHLGVVMLCFWRRKTRMVITNAGMHFVDPLVAGLYLQGITTVSTLTSVYGLQIFYHASLQHLPQEVIRPKFAILQAVLLTTNIESLIFTILGRLGTFPCVGPWNSGSRTDVVYNTIVVHEMFIFLVVFGTWHSRIRRRHTQGFGSVPRVEVETLPTKRNLSNEIVALEGSDVEEYPMDGTFEDRSASMENNIRTTELDAHHIEEHLRHSQESVV